MAIKVKNKHVCEEILSEEGERIGELKFNPEDTETYKKFIDLSQKLIGGCKELDKIENGLQVPEGDLETVEDFEKAGEFFESVKNGIDVSVEMFDEICRGFDEIFGKGTCEMFTRGSKDPDLLVPLIEGVMPYFQKSRDGKTSKYLTEKKEDGLQ